ncbi:MULTISPECIES: c-type cytochrome [unclassified Ancylobacter]|jgi:cytochrome c|uniref:c-type cytochrome n=1 Tax=unclassified Ancylobacter TaxID=2626613 RepID=UPI0022710DC3|nr:MULTISPECIES: cytochrome c family protein [unclassified Ancylobacter]WAC26977.1 cytochrome c family protein [Ancylobacter sp. SL191]WGD30660.1 cytochrome c family protein [Ancylobacter sp. WKF20]
MNRFVITAALLALGSSAALAQSPAGDPAKGANVFKKCMACHAVGEGAKNKVGPELNGIVGRKMGAVAGFNYSDTLKEHNAKGDVWTPEVLSAYLENPKGYMPGIKMVFAGLPKETDRADLLAYLSGFNEDGTKK